MQALTVNYNGEGMPDAVPTYLFDQAETYAKNPLDAALEWFSSAIMGVSVHFGLPALLGKGENPKGVLTDEQYNMLPQRFGCEHFDAIDIVEMTIAAGARYVRFPAVLPDGFALFSTATTDFNSLNSKGKRNLVAELASTCEFHGIGLFLEYHFGENRHLYQQGIQKGVVAQTEYCDFVKQQLHELLTGYGPLAGICFKGLENVAGRDPAFDLKDIYDMIHFIQPNALVSFEDGATGDEDILSVTEAKARVGLVDKNAMNPVELMRCMSGGTDRGFRPDVAGKHMKEAQLWEELKQAHAKTATLLVNTALMPDGSLDLEDIKTLLAVGERMELHGRP